MECTVEWLNIAPDRWEEKFRRIPRSNLLQHYSYALAVCPLYRQRARWGLIRIDGEEAGMMQILEAGILWNLFHAIILDRGPLWFNGFGDGAHHQAFFKTFTNLYPARFGRKRRILPEIESSATFVQIMEELGYSKMDIPDYQTIWMDLTLNEENHYRNLNQNWRRTLKKSDGLEITWDRSGAHGPWLLAGYMKDKAEKGYDGPSAEILTALISGFGKTGHAHIGRAMMGKEAVAGILILSHGASATYQIGWTTDKGRDRGAHHALLWDSLRYLKERNISYLDLGGVNDDSAKGVKKFKNGMGGNASTLSGIYS